MIPRLHSTSHARVMTALDDSLVYDAMPLLDFHEIMQTSAVQTTVKMTTSPASHNWDVAPPSANRNMDFDPSPCVFTEIQDSAFQIQDFDDLIQIWMSISKSPTLGLEPPNHKFGNPGSLKWISKSRCSI